jgi:hypothetical protein
MPAAEIVAAAVAAVDVAVEVDTAAVVAAVAVEGVDSRDASRLVQVTLMTVEGRAERELPTLGEGETVKTHVRRMAMASSSAWAMA